MDDCGPGPDHGEQVIRYAHEKMCSSESPYQYYYLLYEASGEDADFFLVQEGWYNGLGPSGILKKTDTYLQDTKAINTSRMLSTIDWVSINALLEFDRVRFSD